MLDASAAVQKAIRARLIATPAVLTQLPAGSILDRNERPAPSPSIIIGEDQVVQDPITLARDYVRVHSTLHLWKKEQSFQGVKAIAGAMWLAIGVRAPLDLGNDFICCDCRIENVRYMRDPDGETSHGVMTVNTLVRQILVSA